MRVYTLMENQPAGPGYAAEHGLSLYVQAGGRALLVDMGQGDGFLRNAAALGVDISQVEAAILTHGHYDHGGGLGAFFGANLRAVVYSRREPLRPTTGRTGAISGWIRSISGRRGSTGRRTKRAYGRGRTFAPAMAGPWPMGGRRRACTPKWAGRASRTIFPTSNTWCWRKGAAGWYSAAVPTRGYATLPPGCGRMCSSAGFTCGRTPTPPWWSR